VNLEIIIKGKVPFAKSRSEGEENIRKEWGRTMSDERLDKLKYNERRLKEKYGTPDRKN